MVSTMSGLSLLYLCCLSPVSSSLLTVLETTSDLAVFNPHTGAQLDNSSTLGYQQVTICAMFFTYQFTTHQYEKHLQSLLGWGKEAIGSFWLESDLTGIVNSGGLFKFPIWDMKVWNHVCIMLDSVNKDLTIVMNGKSVFNLPLKSDLSILDTNISLMCYPTPSGYNMSFFGRMTDVNMWSLSLSKEEAVSWTLCRSKEGGDLVDWRTASWKVKGLMEVQVEREEVCRERQERLLVSDFKHDFDETLHLARMLGGTMAVADSMGAAENIRRALDPVKEVCTYVFTGFTDRQKEGEWVNVYKRENSTWQNWEEGEPDNMGDADCSIMDALTLKQYDTKCFYMACTIIQTKEKPKFQLKGVCKDSIVDLYYTILFPSENETILKKELVGFKQTQMIWSVEQERWNIVNLVDKNTLAHTNSTHDFPFGSHRWFFTNATCSEAGQPWRQLNLQQKVKQPGQFCCDNGLCIDSEFRCDGNNHCLDSSDEQMCQTVQVPQTYNLDIPPLLEERSGVYVRFHPLEIATTVAILNILNINEHASLISLKFGVALEWSDYRLKYNFLKADGHKNTIKSGENVIWTPKLTVLVKSDQTKSVEVQHRIKIKKRGPASIEGKMENIHANESYTGSENPISLVIRYQGEFYCDFAEIGNYPFDTEACSVEFHLSETMSNLTELIPALTVRDHGPSSVGQYSVKRWRIESGIVEEGVRGVKVTVELGRSIGSIFTVTYLPTILMNLVNQATNYIKNNFDLVMTVNITCMMVLASVYISVSSSLPLTAGMKSIDYWLFFNLVYPAMVIIVNIFLQVNDLQ